MVVFVIWYSLQRIVNRHRFLKYTQILRDPTTSEVCKNFSKGLGYTLWVSRRSAWIRAFERTYFHDHPMRRSKKICEKLILMWKKPCWGGVLNLTFLAVFSSKNGDCCNFKAVYGPRNVPDVIKNILNVCSNLKLICTDQGLHWNALVLMLVVIVKNVPFFEPFVPV